MRKIQRIDPNGYTSFVKQINIVKDNYHGKVFEGNECTKILKNLSNLEQCLKESEHSKLLLDTLKSLKQFFECCCGTSVTGDWRRSIQEVKSNWSLLHHNYKMTVPNKVHIITDHVEDYIDATGHGLGTTSDQIVEACHSQLNKRLVSSNYWVKELTSEIHGIKLFKAILHFNSYNI